MNKNPEESPEDQFDEVLDTGEFFIGRKGRFTLLKNYRTPEQHKAFLDSIPEIKKNLSLEMQKRQQELEHLLIKYDPFDVLANLKLKNGVFDPETFKEYENKGNNAYVEYASCVYLTIPENKLPSKKLEPLDFNDLAKIDSLISELFLLTTQSYMFTDKDGNETPSSLDRLRFETIGRSLIVRYMYYTHHLEQVLRGLFVTVNSDLKLAIGFDLEDALKLIYAFVDVEGERLTVRISAAKEEGKVVKKAVKNFRKKQKHYSQYPDELIGFLATLKPSEAKDRIEAVATTWAFYGIGDYFAVTPADLAQKAGIDEETTVAYLKSMSLRFGSLDAIYKLPHPTPPNLTKTLLVRENKYFNPVSQQQIAGLQEALENLINPNSSAAIVSGNKVWKKYEQARAKFLENQAMELLTACLKPQQVYQNLLFSFQEHGKQVQGELDGFLLLDGTAFLIEAKAGGLTLPAKRGAQDRLMKQLKELVANAFLQGARAKKYLENNERAEFTLDDGSRIEINTKAINRYYIVNVTLETLDAFVTNMHLLQDLELLDKGNERVWSVALTDLMVITDLVEFPSQLIHYLERRIRLAQLKKISSYDELDWFGHYLSEGLYFESWIKENPDSFLNLQTYTTQFDDYYLYIQGVRKTPAKKPEQEIPEIMRRIILELESKRPSGYVEAICRMLDWGSETRQEFARQVERAKMSAFKDRQPHDFSLLFDDEKMGMTYMTVPVESSNRLQTILPAYSQIKKYQMKYDKWLALGSIADAPTLASYGVILDYAWEQSDQEEENVKLFESHFGTGRLVPLN